MEEEKVTTAPSMGLEQRIAKVVSTVFTPFSIPFLAFLILLLVSYLRMLPLAYKLIILGIVYTFTILTPSLAIWLYCRLNKLSTRDLTLKEHRYLPFLLTILSYVCCLLLMRQMNIPWYMSGIILVGLLSQVLCILLNLFWKVSEHMAGAGAIVGGDTGLSHDRSADVASDIFDDSIGGVKVRARSMHIEAV